MNLSEIEVEKLKQIANRYKGPFADTGHVNSLRAPSALRYARFGCSLIKKTCNTRRGIAENSSSHCSASIVYADQAMLNHELLNLHRQLKRGCTNVNIRLAAMIWSRYMAKRYQTLQSWWKWLEAELCTLLLIHKVESGSGELECPVKAGDSFRGIWCSHKFCQMQKPVLSRVQDSKVTVKVWEYALVSYAC